MVFFLEAQNEEEVLMDKLAALETVFKDYTPVNL